MKRLLMMTLVGCLVVLPALADGPETGTVIGTITDASGSPLPGVMVTLEGERGTENAVTDANGTYRFSGVVPGSYKVKAELEGFAASEGTALVQVGGRSDVPMKLGMTTAEEITVTSESPMVDKYNVTAGASMQGETAGEIGAAVRSFYGALQVLPGVTNDVESMDLSQSRPTVNGALWQESNVYVDGVDATFTLNGGGTRVFLPTSALTEVSMEAGGGGAEYGRNVGSHTNLIVKSGTNKFHGDLSGVYSDDSWNANYDPQPALAQDQRFVNTFLDQGFTLEQAIQEATNWVVYKPNERQGDEVNIEASVGGPILRDKAWFFASRGEVTTNQLDKTLDGQLFNSSSELFATIGKVNFQPGAKHSLAFTYIDAPVDRIFLLPQMGDRYNATFYQPTGGVASGSWNWSISQNLFLEAKLASQVSDENTSRPFPPEVKAQDPNYLPNPALGGFSPNNNDDSYVQRYDNTWHNGWIFAAGYGTNEFPRDQANLALTQFLGTNNELKYGVDLQQVEWNQNVQRPDIFSGFDFLLGTSTGYANGCAGVAVDPRIGNQDSRCFYVDYRGHGLTRGSASSDGANYGYYVRDRLSVGDHWTFNLGLRLEQQKLENDRGRDVIDSSVLSPRFNTVYDLKGDGRQLITFSAGRFFVQTPQGLVNTNLQEDWNGASNAFDLMLWGGNLVSGALPPNTNCAILDSIPTLPIDPQSAGRWPYCFQLGQIRPGQMWQMVDQGRFNIDIDPYHRDEFVLGYEWQFNNNWAFDVKGIYWRVDDLIGSTIQRDQNFRLFLLVENYDDYAGILRNLNFVQNFVTQGRGTAEQAEAILNNFEDDNREYQGLQLQLNRRFRNGWSLYNNVTFSKVEGSTYGGGAGNDLGAFDNLGDDYGGNLEAIMTDPLLNNLLNQPGLTPTDPSKPDYAPRQATFCANEGLTATCLDDLRRFVGQPLSTINREGELAVDRPIIFKSYGYKVWEWGKQNFNLGGLFVWQSGSPWQRTRTVTNPTVTTLDNARNANITLFMVPRGTFENTDFFWLNLSGAWTFPLGWKDLQGRLRLEVINATDEQDQVATSDRTGAPLRSRRSFQQPTKYRLLASVRF